MPTISIFYGIIIRMYFAPGEHPPAHFHAAYAEHEAVVEIGRGEIVRGSLPTHQARLVLAWTELHREELLANWRLLMNGNEPQRIAPLT